MPQKHMKFALCTDNSRLEIILADIRSRKPDHLRSSILTALGPNARSWGMEVAYKWRLLRLALGVQDFYAGNLDFFHANK